MRARIGASRTRRLRGCVLAAIAIAELCCAGQAGAYVYWSNTTASGAIGRANLDGTGALQSFIPASASTAEYGMTVDGQHLYWTNSSNAIGRANLDGSGANPNFIVLSGTNWSWGVAVDGQHIYWTDYSTNSIGRANLDGTGVNPSFISGASVNQPYGLAVGNEHIYWANYGTDSIQWANLDGTHATTLVSGSAIDGPDGVAVDGQHIYWTSLLNHSIGQANLDGTLANRNFILGVDNPNDVAVDGQHVYWANNISTGYVIGRANLDGSSVNQSFITGASGPAAVAVDAGPAGTLTSGTASVAFATQSLDTLGSPQSLTLSNSGHGELQIQSVFVSGANPDDFLISYDTCIAATLPVSASCTLHLRFGPTAAGSRSGTLTVTSNDIASPLQIALTGTGGPQQIGATGPAGATGPRGPQGKSGQIELITCIRVTRTVKIKGKRRKVTQTKCTGKLISGPVKFTAAIASAKLSRGHVTYATGTATLSGTTQRLSLHPRRALPAGRYTLTLTYRLGGRSISNKRPVTVR